GRSFRWLVTSSWTSNLGDGIGLAAGPLLIASQTRDPLLVALAALLQRLPWLVFGLWAGVMADRLERRRLVVGVDLGRAGVLTLLSAAILTGTVGVVLVLVAMLLIGTAEVFADTASQTLLPMVVDKEDLAVGNARLMAGFLTTNQLVGPALGAALFAAAVATPFITWAVLVAVGALLVSRVRAPAVERPDGRSHVRRDIDEGLAWTWRHHAVRTLTLTIVTFNVTWGAAWSVLVLYAHQRLGLGPVGFGLLNTILAVGGLAGIGCHDWLTRHISLANVMRGVLLVETLTHLGLALTTTAWAAGAIMFVFGAEAFIWGTTSQTVRMRAVPAALQGRVASLYMIGVYGGLLVGQALGGAIARVWGITAPFWFAFAGSALMLAMIWRQLRYIADADVPVPARA
ncbi:MAG TPA: MFS transporter, partial [Solirubrobacter sp.]